MSTFFKSATIGAKSIPVLSLLMVLLGAGSNAQDTLRLSTYVSKYKDLSLSTYHALEDCRKYKKPYLVIPKGTHHYYPDKAFEKYCRITNNTNGLKRIAFPIIDQNNLTIVGNGANIILHGVMMGALVHNSSNITLNDLSFDWAKPYYVQARVVEVDKATSSYTLIFDKSEQFDVVNNDLVFRRTESDYYIGSNFWFDHRTRAPVYNLEKKINRHWNPYKPPHYKIEYKGQHTVHITNTIDSLPRVGWHFIAKWRNQPNINRTAPAIHIQGSRNTKIEKVAIYSAAGMGIIGEKSETITLDHVTVTTTPDSDRIVSTTADATHFVNCKGLVTLKNCVFQNCLDDGLNIHGNYVSVEQKTNDSTLIAEVVHRQQKGFIFAEAGDTLNMIDPGTLLPVALPIVVKDYRQINESYFEITSTSPLPDLEKGYGLDNVSWTADLTMQDCRIERNWARGILVKTAGTVLVENNYISSSMSGIRNWGEMNFFNESGNVSDVTIRNNTFENVCRVGNGHPAIVLFPQIKDKSSIGTKGYYNRNITIDNNVIKTFDTGILFAQSVDGLRFTNNLIVQTTDFVPIFPGKPMIEIVGCRDVVIQGNTYSGNNPTKIEVDEQSTESMIIKKNKGFSKK